MKYKRVLIVGLLVLLLIVGGIYIASKGRLSVTLTNVPNDATVELTIVRDGDQETKKTIQNNSTVVLRSGTYTVTAQHATDSIIKTVTVPSFFGTSILSSKLINEQQRTFVGTNPSPCALYVASTFYSSACGDNIDAITQQIVPTLSSPGYTTNVDSTNLIGTVSAVTATDNTSYLLLENSTDEETIRELVPLGAGLQPTKRILLPANLKGEVTVVTNADSVLVYSPESNIGYIYIEATGSLSKIDLPKKEADFQLVDLSLTNNRIVTVQSDSELSDGVENDILSGRSKIFVQELGKPATEYSVQKLYKKVVYCGLGRLCALSADGLDVYTTQNDSLKKTRSFPGITDAFTSGGTTHFVNKTGVVSLNSQTFEGFYEYSFGKYTSCGVQKSVGGYILCVIDTKNQKHALFISNTDKAGEDDIDKKVLHILQSNMVSGVAAINNFVYVIPDYGDLGIFTQDTETTTRVNQAIDSVIGKSTINKQQYYVINAGSPL